MSSASPQQDLLTVMLEHRVGTLALDIRFALNQPWTVLFGPSGSGKTTVLRGIAGFVRPDAGIISYSGRILTDTEAGVFLPAYQRPVRSAAQHARLFPHLSVRNNVRYGGEWYSKPLDEEDICLKILELFRVDALSDRMPHQLSGGEQKRVSTARALLAATTFRGPEKPLLLLDEPFNGLDTRLRDELLLELNTWVSTWKIPTISVTHDMSEAFLLNAEVIRIDEGRVAAHGPVTTVLADERQRLLASLGEN